MMSGARSSVGRVLKATVGKAWQSSERAVGNCNQSLARWLPDVGSSGSPRCFSSWRASANQTIVGNPLCLSTLANKQENHYHPLSSVSQICVRYRSNRSRRGLYNGKDIGFGNKRSFAMNKSRRKFKPNVFIKRVYSEVLDEMVKFHLTASTLRSIDKAGGLDRYLLKSKYVTEGEGLVAKTRILGKMLWQEKKVAKLALAEESEKLKEEANEEKMVNE